MYLVMQCSTLRVMFMLPTEYLMLTYIIHIDEKEAFNFVISTNISIFIVLKIKCSIRDKQITMFRMYKAQCGGW